MGWKCPECHMSHNETAQWCVVNGQKVTGFCSDECLESYKAKYDTGGNSSSGGGIGGAIKNAALKDLKSLGKMI